MDLLSFLQDEMTPASYADLFSETFQRHPLLCLWGMLPQPNYTATESVDQKRLCHPAPKLFPAMHAVKCFHQDTHEFVQLRGRWFPCTHSFPASSRVYRTPAQRGRRLGRQHEMFGGSECRIRSTRHWGRV